MRCTSVLLLHCSHGEPLKVYTHVQSLAKCITMTTKCIDAFPRQQQQIVKEKLATIFFKAGRSCEKGN